MKKATIPVIFLTFANAPKGDDTHLRNLTYECKALSNILAKPKKTAYVKW